MTIRYLFVLVMLALLLSANAIAQDEDPMHQLLTEYRSSECPEYIHNAEFLVPRLHEEDKLDSTQLILDYIEDRCGSGHFAEYKLLRSIERLDFPDDWCDTCTINKMLGGQWGWGFFGDCLGVGWRSQIYTLTPYQKFIEEYAASLKEMTDPMSIAHLVCSFYAGESDYILARLRRNEFPGTCLQDEYDERIADIEQELKSFRTHIAAGLGIWIPMGNAETLGNKLEMTVEGGFRFGRFGFDVTGMVRVFKSKEFYELYYNERLVPTDEFVGGYVGASFVTELFRVPKYNLELFTGGGYDGFNALTGDEKKSVNSYNINFGLTARYFFNKQRNQFFGLQMRYNIVDYVTHGGTDLSGNTLSLSVVYGYLGNMGVTSRAERLHYYD